MDPISFKRHRPGGMRENNQAENSHLVIRRRERQQQRFKSQGSAQRFISSHGPIYNALTLQPHLISRPGLRTLGDPARPRILMFCRNQSNSRRRHLRELGPVADSGQSSPSYLAGRSLDARGATVEPDLLRSSRQFTCDVLTDMASHIKDAHADDGRQSRARRASVSLAIERKGHKF